MRALAFDVVIDCELFARVSSIFSFLSGAPVRVGFFRHTQEGLYRGTFINRRVMYNPYTHLTQQFVGLAEAIDSRTIPVVKDARVPAPEQPPQLHFPDDRVTRRSSPGCTPTSPRSKARASSWCRPSGGILPIRAWPMEHYRTLCASLLDDGHAVAIIGLSGDKPLGEDLVGQCRSPYCVDLTGYTKTVRHLLALVSSRLAARDQRRWSRALRGRYARAHHHPVRTRDAGPLRHAVEELALLLISASRVRPVSRPTTIAVRRATATTNASSRSRRSV